jgi:hypothetical protein
MICQRCKINIQHYTSAYPYTQVCWKCWKETVDYMNNTGNLNEIMKLISRKLVTSNVKQLVKK